LPERDWAESFRKFGDEIDLVDIEPTEVSMIQSLSVQGRPRSKDAWNVALAHADETAEMAFPLSQADEQTKVPMAHDILGASPFHPFARAVLIDKDWENVKDQVAVWDKESGNSPAILAALGRHYSAAKDYEEARRVVSRYIAASPRAGAFRLLAFNYELNRS
jgi:hypothetical protein